MSDAINFTCPFCREALQVAAAGDRKKILCSNCERAVEVPGKKKVDAAETKPDATEPAESVESYYSVKCRFCDTRMTVSPSQAGTDVKCPDCFSMVAVGPPPESRSSGRSSSKKRSATGSQGQKKPAESKGGDEFSLADTFERPKVSSMYGLDAVDDDLLAPRKPKVERNAPAELPEEEDDGLPALDSLGTFVGGADSTESRQPSTGKKQKQRPAQSKRNKKASQGRPKFEHAPLFIAVVQMLTAPSVLVAAGVSMLVMVIGVCISESIYPYVGFNSRPDENQSVGKFVAAAFLGYLPYFVGLVMLWTVAGFVFRDAAKGHQKVQRWSVAGQADLLSTFLVFAFSFFIAGLPGAVLWLLIMPLRMMVAPLMLISAWFNHSPWEIISIDWVKGTTGMAKQWTTVYLWFGGLAFVGLLAGLVFLARASTTIFVLDAVLSIFAIGLNVVITLVFAAIAGWHCGAVIENLDQED